MIPFNITLNSGVSVAPQKANIRAQDPHYTNIDALHLMIKKRTDIRSLMVDYDDYDEWFSSYQTRINNCR